MSNIFRQLTEATDDIYPLLPRLISGLPLLVIGAGHFFDQQSFMAMLEAAHFPVPSLNAVVAPGIEVVAGTLLLIGFATRLGGLLGVSSMIAALFAHAVVDVSALPAGVMMPPVVLPLAVLAASTFSAWSGGGRWSLDGRLSVQRRSAPSTQAAHAS